MRSWVCVLALCTGCLDDESIDVDDVIPRFEVLTPDAERIADGKSPLTIEVCRTDDDGIAKSVTATLKTSTGAWVDAGSDAKTATVEMSLPCEQRLLVPTTDAGTLSTTATIDTYMRTLPIALHMAPVALVRIGRQGALSSTASSMLTITANLDIAGNGKPSVNTLVSFDVTVETPAGGMAWFSERQVRVVQGTSVQTTLVVAAGVTKLTVTATAAPDGQMPTTSEPFVITP